MQQLRPAAVHPTNTWSLTIGALYTVSSIVLVLNRMFIKFLKNLLVLLRSTFQVDLADCKTSVLPFLILHCDYTVVNCNTFAGTNLGVGLFQFPQQLRRG